MELKANVIHNRDCQERLPALEAQIERQGIVAEFWPAIKGMIDESHKQIIRNAMYKGEDMALVMEDDILFPAEDGFDYFLSKIPNEFDIYLGGVYLGKEQLPNEGNVVKRFSGMHCYIVHYRFYKAFLSLDCLHESIDNALGTLALKDKCKIVCCYPFAAIQQEIFSSTNPVAKGIKYPHRLFFNSTNTYGL